MSLTWIAVIIVGAVIIDIFMLGLMERGPIAWVRGARRRDVPPDEPR